METQGRGGGAIRDCAAQKVHPLTLSNATLSYTFYRIWQPVHIPSKGTAPRLLIFYLNNSMESFNGSSFGDSFHGILKGERPQG